MAAKTTLAVGEKKWTNNFNSHIDICVEFTLERDSALQILFQYGSEEECEDGVSCSPFLSRS